MMITRVECDTCGWWNETADRGATLHSAVVHGWLKPGHLAGETDVVHVGQHPKHWDCVECEKTGEETRNDGATD